MTSVVLIPLSTALRSSGECHGVVARFGRFEVWAHRHRYGEPGRRRYGISFTAIEILDQSIPRKTRKVDLPETCRSNLKKVISYLEGVQ